MSTLWPIEDQGAAELAARFYRRLERLDPASALAQAQQDLMATPEYSSPYFWAGYQLTGEPGPVTGAHQAGRFRSTDQGGLVPSP
jgi:CHAT domain-containing protein